jgi:RNA polymerase sigma-70 factor (ECF subfamily)
MAFFSAKIKYAECSDEVLMQHVQKGDERAFEAIYDRYFKPLYGYFCRMLWKDREKALDFAQDLFTKIIHKPEAYSSNRPFKTWLYSVAHNMCKNEYRKQEIRKGTNNSLDVGIQVQGESGVEIIDGIEQIDFNAALEQAIETLDEKQRSAFIMRYREEMSIKEIAAIFDCSEGTIKSRLFYTLKKLGDQLVEFNPNNTRS